MLATVSALRIRGVVSEFEAEDGPIDGPIADLSGAGGPLMRGLEQSLLETTDGPPAPLTGLFYPFGVLRLLVPGGAFWWMLLRFGSGRRSQWNMIASVAVPVLLLVQSVMFWRSLQIFVGITE